MKTNPSPISVSGIEKLHNIFIKSGEIYWRQDIQAKIVSLFQSELSKAKKEGEKEVWKNNCYKHHSKRLALRKKYYQKSKHKFIGVVTTDKSMWCETHDKFEKLKEQVTNLTDTPVMCKCGDKRKDHYNNWGEYTGCGNKLNCGCSKFILSKLEGE